MLLFGLTVAAIAAPPPRPRLPPPVPEMPNLGPIPADRKGIEQWAEQWPAWLAGRQAQARGMAHLQRQLKQLGEAEQRYGRNRTWWDLPSRRRQNGRLRRLQRLRFDLEQAEARRFQMEAIETAWRQDLLRRKEEGILPEILRPVLKRLEAFGEKTVINKDKDD